MKRRILGILTAMVLCLILLPTVALAAGSVSYLDSNGGADSRSIYTEVTKNDNT